MPTADIPLQRNSDRFRQPMLLDAAPSSKTCTASDLAPCVRWANGSEPSVYFAGQSVPSPGIAQIGDRLARPRQMRHPVGMVDIDRAEIEDGHKARSQPTAWTASMKAARRLGSSAPFTRSPVKRSSRGPARPRRRSTDKAPPDRTKRRTAREQGTRGGDQGASFNPQIAPMMHSIRVATIQSAGLFHLDHH